MSAESTPSSQQSAPSDSSPIGELPLYRNLVIALVVYALSGTALIASAIDDWPALHTILDTTVFLLRGVLALMLWDIASRTDNRLARLLALTFAAVALLELLHTLVAIEWSGRLAQIQEFSSWLRPATWGPPVHLMALGTGAALWLGGRKRRHVVMFAFGLLLGAVALLGLFQWLPRYTAPGWLGVTRPALWFAPLLWLAVGVAAWRMGRQERIARMVALMAVLFVCAHIAMLYSKSPHDTEAMVAHLGKCMGCLFLLMSITQMGSVDMVRRIRAERELKLLNEELEQRVRERTTALAQTAKDLETEIAERKRTEAVRQRMAAIVESSDDAIISKDLNGIITSWNGGAVKLYGYTAAEAIGQPMTILIPPDRLHEEPEILARIARGESIDHFETIRLTKDRKPLYVSVTISPVHNEQGEIVGASKIARDITERKLAGEKLQAQLGRLNLLHQITRATGERQDLQSIFQVVIRSVEDELPVDFSCICLYDRQVEVLTVTSVGVRSEALATELAMTRQSRISIDQNGLSRCVRGQLVYESDIAEVKFPFPERLARGGLRALVVAPLLVESQVFGVFVAARRQANSFSSGECEFLRQLSEHVALAAHQAQLYGALQQAYDDLRQTQQAVMQQERLRALGQMASGIAHDINNAISPAALYIESLLEKEPDLSARTRSYLGTVQHAIDDVAATVARMREFYRQREPQLTLAPVELNRLVQQVLDLTRARWHDMPQQRGIVIDVKQEFAPALSPVMGMESEIREALTNLIFNAVDAMPNGGILTVRTKLAEIAPATNDSPATRQIQVEVGDTGVGMDEDTRRRCMEPFFTTKGERGTGLGLAMVYGVVQRHSAEIEIESIIGKGTTVRLSFAPPTGPIRNTPEATEERAIRSRLRLLLVDDDPLLLKSLRDILEGDGHVIVTANNGQAGIEAFRAAHASTEPFALVITDLGMPYVDGRKVASAVKATSPSTPVILLTGWGQRLVAEGDIPAQVDRVLSKPPKLRELRTALAQCVPSAQS